MRNNIIFNRILYCILLVESLFYRESSREYRIRTYAPDTGTITYWYRTVQLYYNGKNSFGKRYLVFTEQWAVKKLFTYVRIQFCTVHIIFLFWKTVFSFFLFLKKRFHTNRFTYVEIDDLCIIL